MKSPLIITIFKILCNIKVSEYESTPCRVFVPEIPFPPGKGLPATFVNKLAYRINLKREDSGEESVVNLVLKMVDKDRHVYNDSVIHKEELRLKEGKEFIFEDNISISFSEIGNFFIRVTITGKNNVTMAEEFYYRIKVTESSIFFKGLE